ncbi:MAG: apolipoprotein N-acyltransferase [Alphaproteobacteria bacterium]|nr:apolipoprotein N-acyltransferase [Rickettsiales bacterium]
MKYKNIKNNIITTLKVTMHGYFSWCGYIVKLTDRLLQGRFHIVLTFVLLSAFASPPFYFFPISSIIISRAWRAAKKDKTDKTAMGRMLWFYGAYCIAMSHSFIIPMTFQMQHWVLVPISLLLLALVPSCFAMVFIGPALLIMRHQKLPLFVEYLLISTAWFLVELTRGLYFLGGAPWQTSALLFTITSRMLRIASYFNQWQLELLGALILAIPYLFQKSKNSNAGKVIGVPILLWTLMYAFPFKEDTLHEHDKKKLMFNIYGVQGDADQHFINKAMSSSYYKTAMVNYYLGLWEEYNRQNGYNYQLTNIVRPPQIVAFPEGPITIYDKEFDTEFLKTMGKAAKGTDNLTMFASIVASENNDGKFIFQNAISVIDNAGKVIDIHPKKYLVPFGEYVPMRRIMPNWAQSVIGLGDLSPSQNRHFASHTTFHGVKIATIVCYEIAFNHKLKDKKGGKPDIIISFANDGWLKHSTGVYQHLAFAQLRAALLGVPIFHIVNNGPSVLISKSGKILKNIPFHSKGILKAEVFYIEKNDTSTKTKEYIFGLK